MYVLKTTKTWGNLAVALKSSLIFIPLAFCISPRIANFSFQNQRVARMNSAGSLPNSHRRAEPALLRRLRTLGAGRPGSTENGTLPGQPLAAGGRTRPSRFPPGPVPAAARCCPLPGTGAVGAASAPGGKRRRRGKACRGGAGAFPEGAGAALPRRVSDGSSCPFNGDIAKLHLPHRRIFTAFTSEA